MDVIGKNKFTTRTEPNKQSRERRIVDLRFDQMVLDHFSIPGSRIMG